MAAGSDLAAGSGRSSVVGLEGEEQAMRPKREDTIAVIATAPGQGAVAIVRLSGPRALAIADQVFVGGDALKGAHTHTVFCGRARTAEGEFV